MDQDARLRLVIDNSSGVSLTPREAHASSRSKCQSPGTRLRWRHLVVVAGLAPNSCATAATLGQRWAEKSSMRHTVDISSTSVKPGCGLAWRLRSRQLGMAAKPHSEAKSDIIQRTKDAREESGLSQSQLAQMLGVSVSAYQKYEQRSPLPHELIQQFCVIVQKDPAWLLTGARWPDQFHRSPPARSRRKTG